MNRSPVKKARKTIQIGEVYGDWTIVGRAEPSKKHTRWLVECPSKHQSILFDRNLKTGVSKWCPACIEANGAKSEHYYDVRYGRVRPPNQSFPMDWIPTGRYGNKRGHWLCVKGSSFFRISEADLLSGRRPKAGTRPRKLRSEEYRRTRRSWYDMKRRCDRADHPDHKHYFDRGVRYDDAWYSFDVFLYQMGYAPEGKTLHRINPNDHYFKGNCTWATPKEQAAPGARRPANSKEEFPLLLFQGAYSEPDLDPIGMTDNGITI